ncbi:MAG: hypothetical protein IKF14_05105 [Atopobiaceae bacterium]|nr:hypothetical protein [Atopobiaceae bacterium]MBR3158467.1 hypothetical protein [Atopobiaceae bacterium]
MSDITNIEATCQRRFNLGSEKPTKEQRDKVTRLCRVGEFKSAFKIGREWFVDWEEEKRIHDEKRSGAV